MASLPAFDHALFDWINSLRAPWLDTTMLAASHVGVGGSVWLMLAAILFLFPARRAAAWRLIVTIGLAALIVDGVVKPLIWRDRPYKVLADVRVIDAQPPSSSFPSGHAALSMAGAAAASLVVPGATLVWWALGATIAISRIYVGVHFPFDVLSGALLGLLCARLALRDVKPQHAPFEIGPVGGT
jgi:undecaprenyl-diphosphatase